MAYYALELFKDNSTLYKLAQKYDSVDNGGDDNKILDKNEIKLFNTELKGLGLEFDFKNLKDEKYMDDFQIKYERALLDQVPREELIREKNQSGEYEITPFERDGVKMYKIKIKKEINCSGVSSELNLPAGAISDNNSGYTHWDGPNGTYIGNKPMKGETIYIKLKDLNGSSWGSKFRNMLDLFKKILY